MTNINTTNNPLHTSEYVDNIIKIIEEEPNHYLTLSDIDKKNYAICFSYLEATHNISGFGADFNQMSVDLKKDENFFIFYIDHCFYSKKINLLFKFLYKNYKQNIPLSLMERGIDEEGIVIQFGTEEQKSNRTLAMNAVSHNGFALSHLSTPLRNDLEIVQIAVLSSPDFYSNIFRLAGDSVKKEVGTINPYQYFSSLSLKQHLEKTMIDDATLKSSLPTKQKI